MVEIVPNVKTRKRRDIMVILEFDLNDNKAKTLNGVCLLQITKEKNVGNKKG